MKQSFNVNRLLCRDDSASPLLAMTDVNTFWTACVGNACLSGGAPIDA